MKIWVKIFDANGLIVEANELNGLANVAVSSFPLDKGKKWSVLTTHTVYKTAIATQENLRRADKDMKNSSRTTPSFTQDRITLVVAVRLVDW